MRYLFGALGVLCYWLVVLPPLLVALVVDVVLEPARKVLWRYWR